MQITTVREVRAVRAPPPRDSIPDDEYEGLDARESFPPNNNIDPRVSFSKTYTSVTPSDVIPMSVYDYQLKRASRERSNPNEKRHTRSH